MLLIMAYSIQNNKNKFHNFLLNDCLVDICNGKFLDVVKLDEIHKKSVEQKDYAYVSIAMSYMALNNYRQKETYYKTLNLLGSAKYLANSSDSAAAQKINILCSAVVEYLEKNIEFSYSLFESALGIKSNDENLDFINEQIIKCKEKMKLEKTSITPSSASKLIDEEALLAFLEVGRTIALETDLDRLLKIIARQIQHALQADRCTVFLYDKEKEELWSKVALGLETQTIRFSADKGLAGHVLSTGETINIKDAYDSEYFNPEIDLETGYKTKNILCMPIRNLAHEILGVFQVLNKNDGDFTQKDEDLLVAIGSSAGIAIENANLFSEQKKLIEEQKKLFSSFIDTLSASIDARDKITSGHSKRVTRYASLICDQCHLSKDEKEIIESASLLHDIGKIGIKDSVLQKEGKLTPQEYDHIKQHVMFTHNILNNVYISPDFKEVTEIASSHHEKYDGTGYFKGLKGEEIPLGGRILAICDVFDAITSKRHYRSKMIIQDALKIIVDGAHTHFDENLVDAFMSIKTFDILKVMNDNSFKPTQEDEILLKQFNLDNLYAILINKEENILTEKNKNLVEVFNNYYN